METGRANTYTQAALKALRSYWCNSRKIRNFEKALKRLRASNRVTLVWIPDRAGIQGNEAGDSLARQGTSFSFTGPEQAVGIASATAKATIYTSAKEKMCEYWQDWKRTRFFIFGKMHLLLEDLDIISPNKAINLKKRLPL